MAKSFLRKVKKAADPQKLARVFHKEVQAHVDEILHEMQHPELIQCRQGCSACCYTQVSVTEEEAELLAKKVESGLGIDQTQLYIQAQAENDSKKWYQIDYEKRACVFLDQNQNCRIYEDRPAVCRTNFALSDPEYCDTRDGDENQQRLLLTVKADLVVAVAYDQSKSAGSLPFMLDKALKKRLSLFR